MKKDLANPDSYITRFLNEHDEMIAEARKTDWLKHISKQMAYDSGRKKRPPRKKITVAYERQAIVDSIRDAAKNGQIVESIAEEALAEAGEALSWMDSVPDRMLLEDLPVIEKLENENRNSIVAMRTGLARMSPALKAVMEEGNQKMMQKLKELAADLATEVATKLVAVREQIDRESDQGRG